MNFNSWKRYFFNFFPTPFGLVIDIAKHVLSCKCLWAYLKSITVTVLHGQSYKCALHFANTKLYVATVTHACPVGPHENASMAEYSLNLCGRSWHTVLAADELLLTFELVIAKYGFDTGILYFCYLSNWQKQASNHMKWVRQIHGWS